MITHKQMSAAANWDTGMAQQPKPVAGHTPGEWGVTDKREHIVTVINPEGFEVTIAKCGESYVLSDAEMKANAQLIASAPRLARENEALREALEMAKNDIYEAINGRLKSLAGIIHDIDAALALAGKEGKL